ncbi:MAG TPA: hypothetical protein VIF83_05680 [Gemmatimonadaceae bacterium]
MRRALALSLAATAAVAGTLILALHADGAGGAEGKPAPPSIVTA